MHNCLHCAEHTQHRKSSEMQLRICMWAMSVSWRVMHMQQALSSLQRLRGEFVSVGIGVKQLRFVGLSKESHTVAIVIHGDTHLIICAALVLNATSPDPFSYSNSSNPCCGWTASTILQSTKLKCAMMTTGRRNCVPFRQMPRFADDNTHATSRQGL